MRRARLAPTVLSVLLAASAGFGGCGGDEVPARPVAPPATSDVERALRQAAEAVWAAIDGYDAKAFAAISVNPKIEPPRSPEAKDVEELLTDLHQKYGVRLHQFYPAPLSSVAAETAVVNVLIGDHEDAVSLAFTRVAGAWKLSSISNADPQAIVPAAK